MASLPEVPGADKPLEMPEVQAQQRGLIVPSDKATEAASFAIDRFYDTVRNLPPEIVERAQELLELHDRNPDFVFEVLEKTEDPNAEALVKSWHLVHASDADKASEIDEVTQQAIQNDPLYQKLIGELRALEDRNRKSKGNPLLRDMEAVRIKLRRQRFLHLIRRITQAA